ncbi:MAG: aminotransferase class V-fold PLP-dependent enzyme [Proteobacteria bacterium]|nr:aminotransferase class V-fold PLP-dependent enzyme [Pseudomonadota bacterium]
MEIYLDANATTPVLAQARTAALAAMAQDFGNPSSMHGTGLKARALMEAVRAQARRAIGASDGQVLFVSGATEGIQTAVLSAMTALRERLAGGAGAATTVLYGATEHKAVPEAIRHWNHLLRLGLQVLAIPVDGRGRHDLDWLRARAPGAGLVCTMAVNNETGVISDLQGISHALGGSRAFWLVDGVQALGKLDLRLRELAVDYATFSGHKLYAPKGIGLLYVRQGTPVTPLLAGGGQEDALRSGTENMPGIAALGSVLSELESGQVFQPMDTLAHYRERLAAALRDAFPDIVFNAPADVCLPTTLNFSVPGLSSRLLLDLFDAAEIRVSGGSACSAAKAQPSHVLEAMGLPAWQAAAAVRLSFGPATSADVIDAACERIRACGESVRASCLGAVSLPQADGAVPRLTRLVADGACCYVVADPAGGRCVVIDPRPELVESLAQWIRCRGLQLAAVLATHPHADLASASVALRAALRASVAPALTSGGGECCGWPAGVDRIDLGAQRLSRLTLPGLACDAALYVLRDDDRRCWVFIGDAWPAAASGCGTPVAHDALAAAPWLPLLAATVDAAALLLPAHDPEERFACTLTNANGPAQQDSTAIDRVALQPPAVAALLETRSDVVLVDVREPYEQRLGQTLAIGDAGRRWAVPLSGLVEALPDLLALPAQAPVLVFCRSGNRSARAAAALRRLGRAQAYSVAGGLALWPAAAAAGARPANGA